jgi:hypothetical protein
MKKNGPLTNIFLSVYYFLDFFAAGFHRKMRFFDMLRLGGHNYPIIAASYCPKK